MRYDFKINNTRYGYFIDDLVNGLFIFNDESQMMDEVAFPSVEEQSEVTRLQAEYDSQEYARARATEYAALNQFEMQFDDQRDGTTTWVDAINDIKARFPK
jgi:hypothetical protein